MIVPSAVDFESFSLNLNEKKFLSCDQIDSLTNLCLNNHLLYSVLGVTIHGSQK